MNENLAEDDGYDEAELDELLDRAMRGILATLEARFDPEAGLADLHARRARLAGKSASSVRSGNSAGTGREQG